MLVTEKCFSFCNFSPYLPGKNNGNSYCKSKSFTTLAAKKEDFPQTSTKTQQQQQQTVVPIRIQVSNTILPRAAVAIFGLGFLDAGYSGDWSRIGVISEETEALLKATAFVVVPLCILLIFSFSRQPED